MNQRYTNVIKTGYWSDRKPTTQGNLFVHIPKCGGITIHNFFNKNLAKYHYFSHSQMQNIPTNILKTSFKFTFVRNPWARIASLYHFWKQQDETSPYYHWDKIVVDWIHNKNIRFPDFVESIVKKHPAVNRYPHCKPYIGYMFHNPEKQLDYIGKLETIQQDFENICEKVDVNPIKLETLNKSSHGIYMNYYDDKTRKLVANLYKTDIEYFGYKFGN